jgi:hypothetical protein
MARRNRFFPIGVLALFLSLAALARAQSLQTIHPAGGGQIVYGQVAGQTTEAGAMGSILKSIHNSLGDKPEVGKLFQVRNSESVAVFFNVKRRNVDGGQVTGLIIATKVSTDHVEAALVSDDAARFPKSVGPMMKTLFAQWHPLRASASPGGSSSGSAGGGGPVAALHPHELPDHSASVSLPDGWQILRNSGGGTIVAEGPDGELASLGLAFLAEDSSNPRVQQLMRQLQAGYLRNSVYASALYYPFSSDVSGMYKAVLEHARQKAGAAPVKIEIASVTPVASPAGQRCAHLEGTTDLLDGKGDRTFSSIFCVGPPSPVSGIWGSTLTATSAPLAIAPRVGPTLGAIMESFNVNMAVVQGQAAQIAAPAIAQIHEIGRQASARAQAAHEAEDIHNSSVYQHWDSMDRRSQEFENYQLGYSVISDSQNNAHGTFWNQDADAIVKSDPSRYEYVNAPDYWKGIDY